MLSNISKIKKVFVAGSSGMVGNAICRKIREDGLWGNRNDVVLLSPSSKELNLLDTNATETWFKKNKPDIVIIAAAKVGGILANTSKPADFLLNNLKIQTNTIEASWKFGVKRLLFLGSSCIYPKFSKQPIREEYLLESALEPTNQWYALAKIAGIKLCESLNKQYEFDAISLMPTNLYGIGDNYHPENSHVLPALIRKFHEAKIENKKYVECWGSGKPQREFLYVDDLAEACLFVLKNWFPYKKNIIKNEQSEVIPWLNVGSDYEVTIKELANIVSRIIGFKGDIIWDETKPDGTPRKKLDTSKLNNLGWRAKTNLEEGIKKTVESFQNDLANNILRSY